MLETAAAKLAGGAPVASIVAGRTDAGVHAEGQVAQIDLPGRLPARPAARRAELPHEAASGGRCCAPRVAPAGWNARFSAIGRAYRYRILNRRARPALLAGRVWHVAAPARCRRDARRRRPACSAGTISPRSAPPPARRNRPLRTLDRLDVARDGDLIEIVAEARSFLHHQVRNMVGTLKLVGEGSWPVGASPPRWPPATAPPPARPRRPRG